MIIDLELQLTTYSCARHVVKSVDGVSNGGVVEFCGWGRLADEFVKNSRNPLRSVKQIKVDADGLHYYLEL